MVLDERFSLGSKTPSIRFCIFNWHETDFSAAVKLLFILLENVSPTYIFMKPCQQYCILYIEFFIRMECKVKTTDCKKRSYESVCLMLLYKDG